MTKALVLIALGKIPKMGH